MTKFGELPDGTSVERVLLSNEKLTVGVLTYGAALQSLNLAGVEHSLTLGSDSIDDYLSTMKSYGVVIGPVVNRIAHAKTKLDDTDLSFEPNQNGVHTLHSGSDGAQTHVWDIQDQTKTSVTMTLELADGLGGFPGNRTLCAKFEIQDASLTLTLTATTDARTLMNLANHSYWNLDGSKTFDGHVLRIAADHFLPTTDDAVPTGDIKSVDNLAYDLRSGIVLTPGTLPLDHNFCLTDTRRDLTDVALLHGTTGITMTMATTEPGLQVYDGRTTGNGHPSFENYAAIALEAQNWPNAMNEPAFPDVTLDVDETYKQVTRWSFSTS